MTPLMKACDQGHLPIVTRLIERGADINITDKNGNTPLSLSCDNGYIDIVNLLIDKGCDIDKPDNTGVTPLMKACLNGHLPIVVRLIKRGADINATNNDGNTPLSLSLSCDNGNIDIVNLLIDKGCDINKPNNDGKTPLMNVCRRGHLPIVARLIERGADINSTTKVGNTSLSLSCMNGYIDIVNLLIDKGCDINKPDNNGMTPLMKACCRGRLPIVARLIERGADINTTNKKRKHAISADINTTDKDGDTPLSLSCDNGNIDIVNLLIDKGCDIHKPDNDGMTPLMNACFYGHLPIVARLIEKGADINITDKKETHHYKGCDIDKPNNNGMTPLMKACRRGHLPIVVRLIERGADINTTDKDGDTPLSLSCISGNIDIVNLLIDKGCDIDKPDNDGMTPLMKACRRGHLPIVVRLIERGADINTTDKDGDTSLSLSCTYGNIDIVNLLIDNGCDIHKPDNDGMTPLMKACLHEHLPIVARLIEKGADINTSDKNGETALSLASTGGNNDIVNLLLDKVSDELKSNVDRKPQLTKGTENEDMVIEKGLDIQTQELNVAENPEYLLPFAGSSEDFNKLLSTGTYESFENRVFLCGSCACGKSTLASVLIGSTIPLTWKSTDGLVIHFGRNGINLETHEMVPLTGGVIDQNVLTKVVIGKPNRETVIRQSVDTNQDKHITPSSTDFPKSNQQTIKKDTDYSSTVSHSSDVFVEESKDLPVKSTLTSDDEKAASVSLPKINKIEAYAVREDILKEIKSGKYKIKIAPSDLVDFGGQRSYDMTHQLFVQHGGTFVVMFDGSKDFLEPLTEYPTGDISNETIVKHWVNSILTYCVDESDVDDPMPMIVFAATHSDLISGNKQKMKKEFAKKVTDMFGTHEMNKHIVFDPVYFINGTDKDDHEIKNLKNQLVSIAVNQSSWGQRRPMIWVPLELLIDNMKKDKINVILKTHLAEANTKNGDLSLSEKQLEDFLLTQHALGKLMYFNQPELNSFIILYPPALVNILKSFVTDEMFWPEDETLKNILRKMTDTGIIKKRDLLKLWQQKQVNQYLSCDEFKEYVIQVLVHLDILVLPKRYLGKTDADEYFLVPCTAKNKMPMSFLEDKSFAKRTITLVYTLRKRFIPSSLTFKLIGAVSGIWPIKEENGRPLLYHSAAVLYVDTDTEFRIIVEDTRVVVYLTHIPSKFTISPDIAASIQECLTFTLNDVLKFYFTSIGKSHNNKDVSSLFQVEVGEVCKMSPCVLSISEAKRSSKWVCGHGNEHLCRYSLLWIFDKTQEECSPDCTGLHSDALIMLPSDKHLVRLADQLDIDSCKQLVLRENTASSEFPIVGPEKVPNDDVLNKLIKELGNCALHLGVELGITINSIEQTKTDYRKMYDQTADILRKWKNSTEEKPTVLKLMDVLERVHLGGFQFVKEMYLRK
ncbi:Putative ankyrin repeat protein MM_0045 [Mytilus edulis]|uniref:Ankyrin repeat protein MM_0045 n=1 Tax=Mytilus edulis TaxID=6550 RepID=A0A8S3RXA1_MYTED|nr:Putative ankyrin repeat protein MM_0045 [Mytilus edulis]